MGKGKRQNVRALCEFLLMKIFGHSLNKKVIFEYIGKAFGGVLI